MTNSKLISTKYFTQPISLEEMNYVMNNNFNDCVVTFAHGALIPNGKFTIPEGVRVHLFSTMGKLLYIPELRYILRTSNCMLTKKPKIEIDNNTRVDIAHHTYYGGESMTNYILDFLTTPVGEILLGYSIYGKQVYFVPDRKTAKLVHNVNTKTRFVFDDNKTTLELWLNLLLTNPEINARRKIYGEDLDVFIFACSDGDLRTMNVTSDDLVRLFDDLTLKEKVPTIDIINKLPSMVSITDGVIKKRKRSVTRRKRSVTRRKRSVTRRKRSVTRRKRSVTRR